jgi:hypothetical protein
MVQPKSLERQQLRWVSNHDKQLPCRGSNNKKSE